MSNAKSFKINRKIAILLVVLLVLALAGYGLLQLSKSRTFQFFGGLTSRVETDQQVIALTFDDAPTPFTDNVLQILKDQGIKATFYAIGKSIEQYPDIAKSIVKQGHELGNHSYSHQYMMFRPLDDIKSEVDRTNQLIRDAGFQGEITFRPPNGKKLLFLPWYLENINMKTIMWDVEPDTYVAGNAEQITKNVLDNTKAGSIIVMHPYCEGVCAADREALPQIIEGLKTRGFVFVTVTELLKY